MPQQRKIYTARLLRSEMLSEPMQTKHLEFEILNEGHFDFAAGQFVSMLAPDSNGKQQTRAYSIASAPRANQIDLCLNRVQDGFFSNLLCDMNTGDEVPFHGPHGLFTLRDPLKDGIMIATGTGVAPMRGFVQWLFDDAQRAAELRAQSRHFWLIYGTRYATDIYYRDYFEQVAARNPNFHYIVTLSKPGADWNGRCGYVQPCISEILQERSPEEQTNMTAYICGLNNMVSDVRKLLAGMGWERKSVIFERYD